MRIVYHRGKKNRALLVVLLHFVDGSKREWAREREKEKEKRAQEEKRNIKINFYLLTFRVGSSAVSALSLSVLGSVIGCHWRHSPCSLCAPTKSEMKHSLDHQGLVPILGLFPYASYPCCQTERRRCHARSLPCAILEPSFSNMGKRWEVCVRDSFLLGGRENES